MSIVNKIANALCRRGQVGDNLGFPRTSETAIYSYIYIDTYIYIHYNHYICVHIYIPLHLIIYPDNQIKWLAINVIKPHEPMNHDLHIISPFEIRCWQKNNDRWPPGHHTGQWTTHHLVRGFSHSKLH